MQVVLRKNKRDTAQEMFNLDYSYGLFPTMTWINFGLVFLLLQKANENLTHWLL